jgi:hypothetical protein
MKLLEIKEALSYGGLNNNKSGLLFSEARDPNKWEDIKTSHCYQEMLAEIRDEAEKYLRQPLRALPYSLFKLFSETGSRKEYEYEYFEHRARLNTFAILSLLDGAPRYLEALEDTIWAICDEYTWSLPAHLNDSRTTKINSNFAFLNSKENLKIKLLEDEQTLDLFASETGFALAEILSLLEDKISPLVVYRGRNEVFHRIIQPYSDLNSSFWWETATMNWAAVCAGSIGAAAMYLVENDNSLALILQRVLATMSYFLDGFGDDGACVEGIGYWTYGFGFFTYFAALLKQRTGGKIDLLQDEKVKRIALFQQKCYLTENYVISFSDASLTENYPPGLTCYLKSIFDEVSIPERKYQARVKDDSCHRWAPAVRDFIWNKPNDESDLAAESTFYLKNAQWLVSKKYKDGEHICFAAKGGHNDEPHNHNDVGSFLFHVNGESLLADLGIGEYTRQYFGAERYEFLCTSSRGHSVPIIEGQYQRPGPEYAARMRDFQTTAEEDKLVMDIAKAYGDPNLKSLQRKFVFKKNNSIHLILKDEYEFERIPAVLTERFVTFYQPQILSEGKVRIQGTKSSIDIIFKSQFDHLEVSRDTFMTHESIKKDVYFLDFSLVPLTNKITAEVVFMEVFA